MHLKKIGEHIWKYRLMVKRYPHFFSKILKINMIAIDRTLYLDVLQEKLGSKISNRGFIEGCIHFQEKIVCACFIKTV